MENLINLLWLFYPAALVSVLVSALIVLTKGHHINFTAKGHDGQEVQSSHVVPTPRIGGVAVATGLLATLWFMAPAAQTLLVLMLCAAVPVFLSGLAEDIGIGASPRQRLAAAMASSLIMILISGYFISTGVAPGLDYLLSFALVGGLFTIFVTGAVCHAFNLVDGLNGLALFIAFFASCAMALISLQVGDLPVTYLAGAIAASVLGVLLLNFPFGKIFLGDAGAYTLGFLFAWTGVLLIVRNPELSKWSVLLVLFWPIMDTTAAVVRRLRKKVPVGAPDKMHFHHVIKRVIDVNLSTTKNNTIANPIATVAMLPFVLLPPLLGVATALDVRASLIAMCVSIAMYFAMKVSITRNFKRIGRVASDLSIAGAKPATHSISGLDLKVSLPAEDQREGQTA